jgi:hypothetical protein
MPLLNEVMLSGFSPEAFCVHNCDCASPYKPSSLRIVALSAAKDLLFLALPSAM